MKNRIRIIFLVLIVVGWPCHAADLSQADEGIYVATVDACMQIPADQLKNTCSGIWDQLNAGITPSRRFNKLLQSLVDGSFTETFKDFRYATQTPIITSMLQNPGYQQALHDCYGDDQTVLQLFNRIVERRDRTGKMLAVTVQGASFVASGVLFAALPRSVALMVGAIGLASRGYVIADDLYMMHEIEVEVQKCEDATHQSADDCRRQMALEALDSLMSQTKDAQASVEQMRENIQASVEVLETQLRMRPNPYKRLKIKKALSIYRDILNNLRPL